MDHAELRRRLKPLLEAEERGDWSDAQTLNDELNRDLLADNFEKSPEIVNHFLDDVDIRGRDQDYGETQRGKIRRFVETGEYEDSKPISLWSCGLVVAVLVAGLIWLLR